MTKIEFTMSVDIDDPKAVKACAAFFAALAEGETSEKPAATRRATKKPIAPEVVAADGKVKQQEEEIKKELVEAEKKLEEAKTKNTSGITIDQVRKMVQEKAKDHKTAMVAKLKEYGVPNVTKLGPAHYEEFMTFLKALD